jgi:hypothetical protein
MEYDFARKGDQLLELRNNLTAMVSTVAETANSAAQQVVKDRLMSGEVHASIRSSYQMAARFTTSGSLETCWKCVYNSWRTPLYSEVDSSVLAPQ